MTTRQSEAEFRRRLDELNETVAELVEWWGDLDADQRSAHESDLVAGLEEAAARLQEFADGLEAAEWE